jgi:hypothetical protein
MKMARAVKTRVALILLVAALLVSAPAAGRQEPPSARRTEAPPAAENGRGTKRTRRPAKAVPRREPRAPFWRVRVSPEAPFAVTLEAEEAPLAEVAAELARQLKVPVTVSPALARRAVTLEVEGFTPEAAARALAPQAFAAYLLTGDPAQPPECLGIFLNAASDPPPATDGLVRGRSELVMFGGNTEDGTGQSEGPAAGAQEDRLPSVSFAEGTLAVRARRQPLMVVLFLVAEKLGVPFEALEETDELIDAEFSTSSLDYALRSLSPAATLYVTKNLVTQEVNPVRLVLARKRQHAKPR